MGNDHVYITDREGNLESQTNSLAPYVLFNNGSFLFGGWEYNAEGLKEPFEIRDDVEIPVGEYRFNRVNASFAFDQSRRIAPSVFYSDGQFYNGTLRSISLGVETKLHNRVRVNAFYSRNDVSLPVEGGEFTTNLLILRGVVAFSPRAFVRGSSSSTTTLRSRSPTCSFATRTAQEAICSSCITKTGMSPDRARC